MTKLSDYLQKHKIDARRVLSTSRRVEGLQPEDRAVRLARAQVKEGENKDNEKLKELAQNKRRSGRAVTRPTLDRALSGKPITRKARARVVRAVNAVLTAKGKGEANAADLF